VCGRYVSTSSPDELAAALVVDEVVVDDPPPPRWNVAPTQPIYVVATRRRRGEGERPRRLLGTMRWGLVPSWAQSPAVGSRMINARAETVSAKPAFRNALWRRRCVIPADAWWEWQARPDGKRPHAIRRGDRRPLAFAGLWEVWRDPADPAVSMLRTAAIVTTRANATLRPIHDRMPVVLDGAGVDAWLDPDLDDPLTLLHPAPDDGWECWPVTTRVNAVAHEGPELLEPVPAP
jgi:putative SOS response-associated peptidase YedK